MKVTEREFLAIIREFEKLDASHNLNILVRNAELAGLKVNSLVHKEGR